MAKQKLSLSEARAKANAYCNYQERCQAEVLEKLRSWGLHFDHCNAIVAELIEQGLLNEERFARTYARGKFYIKKWGRNKILQGMRERRISDWNMRAGLSEISEEDYLKTLEGLAEKKFTELAGHAFLRKQKTGMYLSQKGYESNLVWEVLNGLGQQHK